MGNDPALTSRKKTTGSFRGSVEGRREGGKSARRCSIEKDTCSRPTTSLSPSHLQTKAYHHLILIISILPRYLEWSTVLVVVLVQNLEQVELGLELFEGCGGRRAFSDGVSCQRCDRHAYIKYTKRMRPRTDLRLGESHEMGASFRYC